MLIHTGHNCAALSLWSGFAGARLQCRRSPPGSASPHEDTFTWKIEGLVLFFETVFDYRRQYFNDPPGKKVRIMKYRRVATQ
jgi:hypothetical protein